MAEGVSSNDIVGRYPSSQINSNGQTNSVKPEHQSTRLPHGWSEFTNEDGYIYYAHSDGRSQWELPTETKNTSTNNGGRPDTLAARLRQVGTNNTVAGSPTRAELDTMIRNMGTSFLQKWKKN